MSTAIRIKRLIAASHKYEQPFHPAKQVHNYDTIKNDDKYLFDLECELVRMNNALDDTDPLTSNLKCLPYLSTVHKAEQTITQQQLMLDRLDQEKSNVDDRLHQELKLNDELTALKELLEQRLEEIDQLRTRGPDTIITEIQVKNNEIRKSIKAMLSELKRILNEHIAPNLPSFKTATEQERASYASDLKNLVEVLLNNMFQSADDGGYVEVRTPDSPIIHFLLAGQLVTQLPQNPTYIKLRDFGKD